MDELPATAFGEPARERVRRLDDLGDRFEREWAAGRRPRVEDYLEGLAAADRPAALRELMALELELRGHGGERPERTAYRARFAGHEDLVDAVFRECASRAVGVPPGVRGGPGVTDPASPGPDGDGRLAGAPTEAGLTGHDGKAAHPVPAIPGYEVLGELGRGGMGVVYLALHARLNRLCALKTIGGAGDAGLEARARFQSEAEAVARLQHPHIVQIYGLGQHEGRPYLELEHLAGGSLAARLDGTPWRPAAAAALVETLARAVAAAHAVGVVHRDLKPSNILLAADGSPKVADFGLAKWLGADTGLTRTDAIVGTPSYMAPEQATGRSRTAGPPADVFSLGAILYELLTGRPPFKAPTVLETLEQVRSVDPVRPSRLQPGLPRDVETIVLKCLAKEPARRYASAGALAEDLRRYVEGRPILARPTGAPGRAARWCRRNPGLAASATASLLLLVALAVGSTAVALRLRQQQARADRAEAARRVESLATASAESVPYIIEELRAHPGRALPELEQLYADRAARPLGGLRAAAALTSLGVPRPGALVAAVPTAPAAELPHIGAALARARGAAVGPLLERFAAAGDLPTRGRIAAVLLRLGEPGPARELLRLRPDPADRVAFIRRFREWRGDLAGLPELLRATGDGAFTSGMCLAIAGIDPAQLTPAEREGLAAALLDLHRDARDAATHSAAGHALRRWGIEAPGPPATTAPEAGRGWFASRFGLTMIELPGGAAGRPVFLADREVTIALFRRFAADPAVRADGPLGWPGPDPAVSPTDDCPVDRITWTDAVRFCNWLSLRDGRRPAYERSGAGPLDWVWNPEADGFRLPTESEWVLAFRAGVGTRFPVGEQPAFLDQMDYGNVDLITAEPGGRRMPNGWGFFDILGNFWELSLRPEGVPRGRVPLGPGGRVQWAQRGSAYGAGTFYNETDRVIIISDASRPMATVGLRVACGPVASDLPPPGAGPDAFVRLLETTEGEPAGDWRGGAMGSAADAAAEAAAFAAVAAARPDDPRLLTARVRLLVRRGEWGRAADALESLLRRRPGGLYADELETHHDRIGLAALRVLAGDRDGHARLLRATREHLDGHPEPATAMLVHRIGVLAPAVDADPAVAGNLERALRGPLPEGANWTAATLYTLGAAHYRAGRPDRALACCAESIAVAPDWVGSRLNWPIMALACERLGHAGQARRFLRELDAWIAERARGRPAGEHSPPPGVDAVNWLELLALAREAEAVILHDPAFPAEPFAR